MDVIQLAQKGLNIHLERIFVRKRGWRFRHDNTWQMVRNCERSALVLLAAALSHENRLLLPDGWEHGVREVIDLLEYWEDEWQPLAQRKDALGLLLRSAVDSQQTPAMH